MKAIRLGPKILISVFGVGLLLLAGMFLPSTQAQRNTEPIGAPLPNLTTQESALYKSGSAAYRVFWQPSQGLGPVFTNKSCLSCHSIPVGGGDSLTKDTLFGTTNSDGSFNPLLNEGGILLQPQSVASDLNKSLGCTLQGEVLPADATIVAQHKAPAMLGSGLIDAIPDATIMANAGNQGDGIQGVANMLPDYNGVLRPGRFGFKAEEPTLLQIVADAFQHEIGVTNPLNPNEDLPQGNPIPSNCDVATTNPNDQLGINTIKLYQLSTFLAPNTPLALSSAAAAGQQTFQSIGCAKCHIPSMQTASAVYVLLNLKGTVEGPSAALSNQTANLYSDLLLHDMGSGLADGIPMGQASGSQFRTTPLWGLSLRTHYLHDGRTTNLTTAILDHGGEASIVISNFQALSSTDQSNLIAFLNSL